MIRKSVLVVALLVVATNVWAVKVKDVTATKHNLGFYGNPTYAAQNEVEACIFCHTPHGGSLDGPLWNRATPDQSGGPGPGGNAFAHYTSSTLSPTLTGVSSRPVNAESLLCMSCHDGTVAMGSLLNNSNLTGEAPWVGVMIDPSQWGSGVTPVVGAGPDPDAAAGRDLTDDHPISFSYVDVYNDPGYADVKLKSVGLAKGAGIRFFGTDDRVECSSCHDPHVNGNVDDNYLPFLVTSNTGSALCLACHIK